MIIDKMSCDCHTLQEEREDELMKEKRKLSKEVNIHAVETPLYLDTIGAE